MAPHSNILAWKIPWAEEPGRLQSMGSLRVRHDWATSLSLIGEGNGNPLQCSCLENPRDRGAWWAAVYGSHRVGHDWSDLAAAARGFCKHWDSVPSFVRTDNIFLPVQRQWAEKWFLVFCLWNNLWDIRRTEMGKTMRWHLNDFLRQSQKWVSQLN